MPVKLADFEKRTKKAVAQYWKTLELSIASSQARGSKDTGNRSAVTGGKQMAGFCDVVNAVLDANGLPEATIFVSKKLELPGYFRASKSWDMLVVDSHRGKNRLIASMEFKSQAGSFGNNFNNRTEEALGTALDIATAFREGAFGKRQLRPWLGWVMLVEDCPTSTTPVGVKEPHFPAFPEFHDASYAKRYELLLRRMVLEKLYDSAALLLSSRKQGLRGVYREPAEDLTMRRFLAGLAGHIQTYLAVK